jgi:hypothetical protein
MEYLKGWYRMDSISNGQLKFNKPTTEAKQNTGGAPFLLGLVPKCLLLILAGAIAGCGGGSMSPTVTIAPMVAPAITQQPASQSVPMGLTAAYSVAATGESLQFQWSKNGVLIPGATSSVYVTPATAFADTGAEFTVTVNNSAGTASSTAASLTVTARAPVAGDLRFQQVDAPSTVNGWGNAGVGVSTFLLGRFAQDFTPSIGTPFYVGSGGNCGATPVTDGTGCAWAFSEVPVTVSASNPNLLAGYGSDLFDNFQADLQSSVWPAFANGASPTSAASVITSLDLEPANVLFAVSWIQSAQQTGFAFVQNTVATSNIQAAASQEGASSRVITAISNNAGGITYLAYGWQADSATLYEAQVVAASPTDAPTAAATLAAQGFIITATGLADSSGNILLVGTRVQGDTMARPFVAAQGSSAIQTMMQEGYANVGVIVNLSDPTNPYTYLGER